MNESALGNAMRWAIAALVVVEGALADVALETALQNAEWRVGDVVAGNVLEPGDGLGIVEGRDLTLRAQRTESDGVISYACTVADTSGVDRAVTLALVIPLDATGGTWWDDGVKARTIEGEGVFGNITEQYYGFELMASRYPVAAIGAGDDALCLAVPIRPARLVRFLYDAGAKELRAEFDFGLSEATALFPSQADATVFAFRVPSRHAFRHALDWFYKRHAEDLVRRAGGGGTFLTKTPLDSVRDPGDFFFTWHDFDDQNMAFAEVDSALGVKSFLYREPQTEWRTLRGNAELSVIDFDDGTPGMLEANENVSFEKGRASLAPGGTLTIPHFPTNDNENLVVRFTVSGIADLAAADNYDLGLFGRFVCGIRKSDKADNVAKVGAFDYATASLQNGRPLGEPAPDTMTIQVRVDLNTNLTRVFAAEGTVDDEALLEFAGAFPWGGWTSAPDYRLAIENRSPVPIGLDNVRIVRYPGDVERSYENYLAQLKEDAENGQVKPRATLVSGLETAEGEYFVYMGNIAWTSQAPFTVNADPGVAVTGFDGWPNKAEYEYDAYQSLLGWNGSATTMAGIFYDSMEGFGDVPNYRREHWKTTRLPLTFDRSRGNRVCLLNLWGNNAFAEAVADKLHDHGQLLMGNDAYHKAWYHMPFVDIPGREVAFDEPEDTYLFFRSMAVQRPFWTLLNDQYDDAQKIEAYFQRCMFYGIFPSFFHEHDGKSPWYWATPRYYDRDRALFRKYVPLIRALDTAGWEVLPMASVRPETVRIERYGDLAGNDLAYTLHNTCEGEISVTLMMSLHDLGASGPVVATEWLTDREVPVAMAEDDVVQLTLTLPGAGYGVVGIRKASGP